MTLTRWSRLIAHDGAERLLARHAILERAQPRVGEHRFAKVRRDEHAGGHDIGTSDRTLLHQVAKRHILVVVRARAAHRRHARLERATRVGQRGDVRVRVDQSRHDVPSADVDDGRASRRVERLALDLRDLAVADDECGVGRDRATRTVGKISVTQHDDRRRLLRGGNSRQRSVGKEVQEPSFHGCFLFI